MEIQHYGLTHFSILAPRWPGLEEDHTLARFQDHLKSHNLPSKSLQGCWGQRIIRMGEALKKKKKKRLVAICPLLLWRDCWVSPCCQPEQGMALVSVLCRVLSSHPEWAVESGQWYCWHKWMQTVHRAWLHLWAMFGLIGSHCGWEAQNQHHGLSFPFPLSRWHSSVSGPRLCLLKAHKCMGLWCGPWGWVPLFWTSHPAQLWQGWWGTKWATRS